MYNQQDSTVNNSDNKDQSNVLDTNDDDHLVMSGDPTNDNEYDGIEDEVVVTIGSSPSLEEENNNNNNEDQPNHNSDDESTKANAPGWVRDLRRQHREAQRKIREYESRLAQQSTATEPEVPVVVPKRPKLEDFEYDDERFEEAMDKWYETKNQVNTRQTREREEAEVQQREWKSRLEHYSRARTELRVSDYEDAEDVIQQKLSITQQGIIVQGATNPALVVYALGKNQKKCQELASISDPVKFAFAVAGLERELRVTPKTNKRLPEPEKTISGSAPFAVGNDASLERLRADAERTGDYTKVVAYRRNQRQKK